MLDDFNNNMANNAADGAESWKNKFLNMRNTYGKFIQALMIKWYYLVMAPAVYCLYLFLTIMNEKGYIERFEKAITNAMGIVVNVTAHCTASLPVIWDFIDCAGRQ